MKETFSITSSAFAGGARIPARYTCDGENISPPLSFAGVPEGTISLVLTMDDPDVPKHLRPDGLWVHWVVFDMPADVREMGEGAVPAGTMGANTRGALAYGGPCPPDREHRYFFKLYALDARLDLPEGATKEEVLTAMEGHVLAEAVLLGTYVRG